MINFENSLNTAKQQLLAWSSYAKLTEITLVRDAKGQISIYLMPKSKPKIDSNELRAITNTLAKALGSLFLVVHFLLKMQKNGPKIYLKRSANFV